jgi:uncharacterized protein (DUF2336 family)
MGLTSQFKMSDLARLAQSNDPAHRDQLFLALGSLCALGPLEDTATEAAVGQILLILYPKVHQTSKATLSGKLCKAAWADHMLIMNMAQDVASVAQPVITLSPVLRECDLIELSRGTDLEHRALIAHRPNIGAPVTEALLSHDEPDVMTALVENASATLSMESFATCVRVSRRVKSLRAKLTLRNDMPRSLIPSLFAYSDESMRRMIATRFGINGDHLSSIVKEAIMNKGKAAPSNPDQRLDDNARLLVDKLAKADRLSASFIIKSLNDKKIIMFEHALSRLAGVGVDQLREAFSKDPLYALALCCRAARIDRGVFPAIYSAMQSTNKDIPPLRGEMGNKAANAFNNHSPAAAAVALRLLSRET